MAYDEWLAARIRACLAGSDGITETRMFGGVAFLKHGHMFIGLASADLMARVGKDLHADSLARAHVRPMDFTGRPMAGYVFVSPAGLVRRAQLEFWIRRAEQFVATLPAKKPRTRRPRPMAT